MKSEPSTLDKIRRKTTPFQKKLLNEIWDFFKKHKEWPILREICSNHGQREVKKALLGSKYDIGREQSGKGRWPIFELSLLGMLLTDDGPKGEELLKEFFAFQRDLFNDHPRKESSTAAEVSTALGLEPDETELLGALVSFGYFSGGNLGRNTNWNVSAMDEAGEFPKGDLFHEVNQWLSKRCQLRSAAPAGFTSPFPGQPSLLETFSAGQAIPPEIALSLGRLRKKYPDSSKLGFLIMRFSAKRPYKKIEAVIKRTAEQHGLIIIRADERDFHSHLWENVLTILEGCSFGIAIYDGIERNEPNANVGLEVGHLIAQRKPVLIFKDEKLPTLQSDLAGKLYKAFDSYAPHKAIPGHMSKWLEDNGIVVPNRSVR